MHMLHMVGGSDVCDCSTSWTSKGGRKLHVTGGAGERMKPTDPLGTHLVVQSHVPWAFLDRILQSPLQSYNLLSAGLLMKMMMMMLMIMLRWSRSGC